jgi:prephenate dehydrogenase
MPICSKALPGFFTPLPGQNVHAGQCGEFVHCAEKMGAKIAVVDPADHDRFCAWISHLPQMISTALAATLVDEFGPDAPVLDIGGRALREMTRISGSPYSMWRDIAITNKKNLATRCISSNNASRTSAKIWTRRNWRTNSSAPTS